MNEASALPIAKKTKEALTPYIGPSPGAEYVCFFLSFFVVTDDAV